MLLGSDLVLKIIVALVGWPSDGLLCREVDRRRTFLDIIFCIIEDLVNFLWGFNGLLEHWAIIFKINLSVPIDGCKALDNSFIIMKYYMLKNVSKLVVDAV